MIQLSDGDRVLIRMPSWLGDFVMAEPVVRALVEQRALGRGGARISLSAPAPFFDLLEGRFEGVERIPAARESDARTWRGHDVAVFLDGSLRSVWKAVRAGIPARVGWARGGRGVLLTHAVRPALERGGKPLGLGRAGRRPRFLPRPFSSVCHELAVSMGVPVFDVRPRLDVRADARATVLARTSECGVAPDEPVVVVNVGARPGSAKAYDPALWARAMDLAATRAGSTPFIAFVVAGPGEEASVRATLDAVRVARAHPVLDPVAGLAELAAWCARADLVLTADGGVRHVAAAVGTRRVVLFGPTDPRHTADVWEDEQHLRHEVDCGPCHRERCPLEGENHRQCTTLIQPEAIAAAAM